jgi:hypothetical protein
VIDRVLELIGRLRYNQKALNEKFPKHKWATKCGDI